MNFHLYKDGDRMPTSVMLAGDPDRMRSAVLAFLKSGFEIAVRPVYANPPPHLAGIEDPTPEDYRLRISKATPFWQDAVQMFVDGFDAGTLSAKDAVEFLFTECVLVSQEIPHD